ncbi:hypothetical protein [Nesterenkonia pannonica]|uniref:hypothetical protein n=1 Tax=Nesterenkonia pannonica TaxID=1548602 RepID=UPI00216489F4|nr:hypothetical protein [Nesterenkonia pannonica]
MDALAVLGVERVETASRHRGGRGDVPDALRVPGRGMRFAMEQGDPLLMDQGIEAQLLRIGTVDGGRGDTLGRGRTLHSEFLTISGAHAPARHSYVECGLEARHARPL